MTARHLHHLWHVDLTFVPTMAGVWLPWWPFTLPTVWPFGWTVAIVVDHFSREVVAHAAFRKNPSAAQVCRLLDVAIESVGRAPRHLVSDRGAQFQSRYRRWCSRRGIRPRFGAVGRKGSIAIVERFIRSMKQECFRRIVVPTSSMALECELAAYVGWYNRFRPHSALGGAAPRDLAEPRKHVVSFETRPRHPLGRGRRRKKRLRGRLELIVTNHLGRAHLPIVTLREAA